MVIIADWNTSRWLVLSSFFFIFPSIYAYYNFLYFFSGLLFLTSIISANFWRNATHSWRRDLDLFFSKFAFIIFTYNGIIYIKNPLYLIIAYSSLVSIFYSYYFSGRWLNKKMVNWWKFHFLFHILLTIEQMIILHSIIM